MIEKSAKTQKILVAATVVFLCCLTARFSLDIRSGAGWSAETQYEAAASEIVPPQAAPININTASAAELTELPGIGDTLAQRIVDYRNTHGNFTSIEEIQNVSGIGEKRFSDLQDQITVGEEPG